MSQICVCNIEQQQLKDYICYINVIELNRDKKFITISMAEQLLFHQMAMGRWIETHWTLSNEKSL